MHHVCCLWARVSVCWARKKAAVEGQSGTGLQLPNLVFLTSRTLPWDLTSQCRRQPYDLNPRLEHRTPDTCAQSEPTTHALNTNMSVSVSTSVAHGALTLHTVTCHNSSQVPTS